MAAERALLIERHRLVTLLRKLQRRCYATLRWVLDELRAVQAALVERGWYFELA